MGPPPTCRDAAALTANYDTVDRAEPGEPALGVVALVGVVALLWSVSPTWWAAREGPWPPCSSVLGLLTVAASRSYTRGGLGALAAIVVTPQIRTWSRLVLVIGLLGLLAVGLLMTRVERRLSRRGGLVVAGWSSSFGVLDQTNPDAGTPIRPHWRPHRARARICRAAGVLAPCRMHRVPGPGHALP